MIFLHQLNHSALFCGGAVVLWKVKFYFIVQYMPLRPLPLLYCVVGTNKKSLKGNVTILLVRILQMYKIAKYVGLCLYWKLKKTVNNEPYKNLQFIYLYVYSRTENKSINFLQPLKSYSSYFLPLWMESSVISSS